MANYNAGYLYENDLSMKAECTAKTIEHRFFTLKDADGEYDKEEIYLWDTDIVHIGALPKDSYVTDITLLVEEGFDVGATFDLGFIGDFPDDNIIVFQSGIAVDEPNVSIKIPLPVSGVRNPDGSAAVSGVAGGIWNGDARPMPLAIRVNNPGGVTTSGKVRFLFAYSRYDTNLGDGIG